MTSEALQREVEAYIEQTAQLQLPEGDRLYAFINFASEVLALVQDAWPPESVAWSKALEARRRGTLSISQWREVQSEISSYRISLGEPFGMNEAHGDQAAVSFLFALAIESPVASAHEYRFPELGRLLDEFSCEFIEHFGSSQKVLGALRRAFHVVDI